MTGGSKGIGLAIAELFAAEGANVAICARNADEVGKVVKALAAKGVKSWGRAVDVADPDALKGWIEGAAARTRRYRHHRLQCQRAGGGRYGRDLGEIVPHRHDAYRQFGRGARCPIWKSPNRRRSSSSRACRASRSTFAAGSYGAFKAALIHYAKGLSNQLIAKGIRVNAVSPGNTYFEGGIWQNIERGMPDLYKTAMSFNPTGRMGTPQEVAAGVVFLASPVASRISGTNLIIDGALTKAV